MRAWCALVIVAALAAHAHAEGEAPTDASSDPSRSSPGSAGAAANGETATGTDGGAGEIEQWGAVLPGKGYLIGRTSLGEVFISVYALWRYINQLPPRQVFFDHLGNEHPVNARNDIFSHRVMVSLKGWLVRPELVYQITHWTVNTTDQRALFGVLGYQLDRRLQIYAGLNGLPGTRTLLGNHPWWLGHDRVMADEYFRPFFTNGVWASGEVIPGLWYTAMLGNNLSALGVTAAQLTRSMAGSGSVWWMPTTHEFGPNGSFDDWEWHDHLATRFGASATTSKEDRFADITSIPDNTTIRMPDSLNVFDTGALAPGVTVTEVHYRMVEADAGIKYKGVFIAAQYFQRWLDDFRTDGPLPFQTEVDKGFYVQAAFYPVKHKVELYSATSFVFGDKRWNYGTSWEVLGGANWFFGPSRDFRVNGQLIWVNRSPVNSTFGYYTGGQLGPTIALATSVMF